MKTNYDEDLDENLEKEFFLTALYGDDEKGRKEYEEDEAFGESLKTMTSEEQCEAIRQRMGFYNIVPL